MGKHKAQHRVTKIVSAGYLRELSFCLVNTIIIPSLQTVAILKAYHMDDKEVSA